MNELSINHFKAKRRHALQEKRHVSLWPRHQELGTQHPELMGAQAQPVAFCPLRELGHTRGMSESRSQPNSPVQGFSWICGYKASSGPCTRFTYGKTSRSQNEAQTAPAAHGRAQRWGCAAGLVFCSHHTTRQWRTVISCYTREQRINLQT